jgi:two-component system, response regulator
VFNGMTEKTILLVEDNECDVFLTRRALAKLNIPHQLIVAKDGVEAHDYLFGNQSASQKDKPEVPDLVLLDLKLPRIDGLQILKQIRSDGTRQLLPVAIVTSSSEPEDIDATNQLGATAYCVKPVNANEYIEMINKLITNYLF